MARPVNEERRKEKLELILEGARAVFCRKGFLDVNMKDIIEECGISRGGIYLYFSSVDEIFQTLISRRDKGKFESIRQSVEENTDFFQLLDRYFTAQKQRLLNMENSLLRATYEYRFTHKEPSDQAFQTEQIRHVKNTILEILKLGVKQKAIKEDNIPELAENFMYVIEGLSVLALIGDLTQARVDRQFRLMRDILLEQGALSGLAHNLPLRVLVTAGDTSERIDELRRIVNPATGRLGSLTADVFALTGAKVTYVGGAGAMQPTQIMQCVYTVDNVWQLGELLDRLLQEETYDCIVHSMSVSEYTLHSVTTAEKLSADIINHLAGAPRPGEKELFEVVKNAIQSNAGSGTDKRIPPDLEGMVLLMNPVPPILARMGALQPNAVLVGFKLLVDVDRERLTEAAMELIERDGCDFVLSNDVEDISESNHRALLVSQEGEVQALHTKQEIAQAIVRSVLERIGSTGALP